MANGSTNSMNRMKTLTDKMKTPPGEIPVEASSTSVNLSKGPEPKLKTKSELPEKNPNTYKNSYMAEKGWQYEQDHPGRQKQANFWKEDHFLPPKNESWHVDNKGKGYYEKTYLMGKDDELNNNFSVPSNSEYYRQQRENEKKKNNK